MGSKFLIILDTHIWLWWVNDSKRLSSNSLNAIEKADKIGIPIICCWEIAMLVAKKRIGLSMDISVWIDIALQYPKVELVDLTPEIAILSTQLPGNFHSDPADRLIKA